MGHATSVVNIQRQLASALGVAVLGTILTHGATGTVIRFGAFHAGVVVIASLALLAGGVAWWASVRRPHTQPASSASSSCTEAPESSAHT
jgi:hypothetical protein